MTGKSRVKRRRWSTSALAAGCLAATMSSLVACDPLNDSSPALASTAPSDPPRPSGTTLPLKRADGGQLVRVDGCAVYAQTKPGAMRWYTPGGSKDCRAWVVTLNGEVKTYGERAISTNESFYSAWYPVDSNGYPSVCVNNQTGQMECSPDY